MYDPLSTAGKVISRRSQGSSEGEARGTSEASQVDVCVLLMAEYDGGCRRSLKVFMVYMLD